jgi:hypothetical protein
VVGQPAAPLNINDSRLVDRLEPELADVIAELLPPLLDRSSSRSGMNWQIHLKIKMP